MIKQLTKSKFAIVFASLMAILSFANASNAGIFSKEKAEPTFYYTTNSVSLATRIVMNECNFKVKGEKVDLRSHKTEFDVDYYTINEKGAVPALRFANGDLLTENAVIMQYIADKAENTKLLPKVRKFKRYKVLEMTNFISTEIHKSIGVFFFKQDKKYENAIITKLKRNLSIIDKNLEGKEFLVGKHFTIADAYMFAMLFEFARIPAAAEVIKMSEYPNLDAYYKRLVERKSVVEAMEQEGIIEKASPKEEAKEAKEELKSESKEESKDAVNAETKEDVSSAPQSKAESSDEAKETKEEMKEAEKSESSKSSETK